MRPIRQSAAVLTASSLTLLLAAAPAAEPVVPYPLPPKDWPEPIQDSPLIPFLLIDRLEQRWRDGADTRLWDAQGWIGTDYHKFWFKTEGEDVVDGAVEEAEFEALYARLIAPFWHLQAGLRHDLRPEPSRSFAVLGIQGLAPYWFETEAAAYLSDDGDLSARIEAEYDLPFTQRLILQPRLETHLAASDVEDLGIGQGFNDVELSLRLRYEIRRELAPYLGVSWNRKLGESAGLAREEGEDVESVSVVAGVRVWF